MSNKVVVNKVSEGNYLLWVNDQQRASFTESSNWGPDGLWNGSNWHGPDAGSRAELEANRLGDHFGVKVDKRL